MCTAGVERLLPPTENRNALLLSNPPPYPVYPANNFTLSPPLRSTNIP